MEPLGQLERQLLVVGDVARGIDVGDQVILLDVDRVDLPCSVDYDHAIGLGVPGGNEAKLIRNFLSE